MEREYPDLLPTDERTALRERLDQYRTIVASQISDVEDEEASAHPLSATDLTMGGIVKHLAWAEDHWFQARLLGVALPEPWASAPLTAQPDWPLQSARADSVRTLLDLYGTASDRAAPRSTVVIPSMCGPLCLPSASAPSICDGFWCT